MKSLPSEFLTRPICHRGLHDLTDGRPENSRASFHAAIRHGYGIELDLQLSRDGRAMVFHDYDLKRLTGRSGTVQASTVDELAQLPLIGGTETVPTLSEILTLVDGQAPLLIELKDQHGQMGETDGRLEKAVASELQAYSGPAAVMSFNPNMMLRLKPLTPQCPHGLVTCGWTGADWPMIDADARDHLRRIPDFEALGASFISHDIKDLNRDRVAEIKAMGGAVLCWTVRSAEAEAKARQVADNITFEKYLARHPD